MGMPAPRTAVQQGRDVDQRLTLLERAMARLGFVSRDTMAHVGDVKITARATPPTGWLLCQGQSLLRAEYPALFDAIGVSYGSADATHFSLPDLRGRVPVGQDVGQTEFDAIGEKGGEKTHTLTASQLPAHQHMLANPNAFAFSWGAVGGTNVYVANAIATAGAGAPSNNLTTNQNSWNRTANDGGGGEPHNNLQPFIVLNYLIKT